MFTRVLPHSHTQPLGQAEWGVPQMETPDEELEDELREVKEWVKNHTKKEVGHVAVAVSHGAFLSSPLLGRHSLHACACVICAVPSRGARRTYCTLQVSAGVQMS